MANTGAAADASRQREEVRQIIQNYLAQLVPGSPEYTQLQSVGQQLMDIVSQGPTLVPELGQVLDQQPAANLLGQQLVSQFQKRVAGGDPATPLEARTNTAFQGLRSAAGLTAEEQDVLNSLRGTATTTPTGEIASQALQLSPEQQALLNALRGEAQTTPLGEVFSESIGRAQNPDEAFTSTFEPQLKLLQDQINREAIRRGDAVLGGGLPLEALGRAGSELAIREAQAREDFRQQQLQNALGLASEGLNVPSNRLAALQSVFATGQNLRGRQIGLEESNVNLQQGRESRLTDLLASQSAQAQSSLENLLARQTQRQESLEDVQRAQEQARRQQLLSLGGLAGGALLGGVGALPLANSLGLSRLGAFGLGATGNLGNAVLSSSLNSPNVGALLGAQQSGNLNSTLNVPRLRGSLSSGLNLSNFN